MDALLKLGLLILIGIILADAIVYCWHRWGLHGEWKGPYNLGRKIRLNHTLHHHVNYPSIEWRKARPYNSAGEKSWLLVGGVFLGCLFALAPLPDALIIGSVACGYGVLLDKLHDYSHITGHWLDRYSWFRVMTRKHQMHHTTPGYNMGILFFWADRIFKTYNYVR